MLEKYAHTSLSAEQWPEHGVHCFVAPPLKRSKPFKHSHSVLLVLVQLATVVVPTPHWLHGWQALPAKEKVPLAHGVQLVPAKELYPAWQRQTVSVVAVHSRSVSAPTPHSVQLRQTPPANGAYVLPATHASQRFGPVAELPCKPPYPAAH